MRVLVLDAALGRCAAALVENGRMVAERRSDAARGHAALLPAMAQAVLPDPAALHAIAVTIGPGSFTGLRAALSLAHGIALATALPVVGVTVGEAFAGALPRLGGRVLWSAIESRRGRVFLEIAGTVRSVALDALPAAAGRVALAGDAAIAVAVRLAARGSDVMLTDVRLPETRHIAAAAEARIAGALPPRAALPLYVDAPEAKLPAGGLRPAPA